MKQLSRTVKSALAVGVAGLAIPLATTATANAAADDCPSGYFCLWDDANFKGLILTPSVGGGNPDFTHRRFNDRASSAMNSTDVWWCVFDDINYQGTVLLHVPPNSYYTSVADNINDRASSARPC